MQFPYRAELLVVWMPRGGGWVFNECYASFLLDVKEEGEGVLKELSAHVGLEVLFVRELW